MIPLPKHGHRKDWFDAADTVIQMVLKKEDHFKHKHHEFKEGDDEILEPVKHEEELPSGKESIEEDASDKESEEE